MGVPEQPVVPERSKNVSVDGVPRTYGPLATIKRFVLAEAWATGPTVPARVWNNLGHVTGVPVQFVRPERSNASMVPGGSVPLVLLAKTRSPAMIGASWFVSEVSTPVQMGSQTTGSPAQLP